MSVNNESKPSATPPLPHTMLLLAGTFRSTLNGGGGGLEFYTNNRFARSSPVFNNVLNTSVPGCIGSYPVNVTLFSDRGFARDLKEMWLAREMGFGVGGCIRQLQRKETKT